MKLLLATALLATSVSTYAFSLKDFSEKSICGVDDRVFSYDAKIGRAQKTLSDNGGCSITMIGNTCAISAGHCKTVLKYVEFNTAHPDSRGDGGHAEAEDIYEIDQDSIVYQHSYSEDWAVFKLLPHSKSGRLPGAHYGMYPVSFDKPKKGATVVITGYGVDRSRPERNCTQQTHSGEITKVGTFSDDISYTVDTEPGNSGSSVILEQTGEIVAIHTNGGCTERGTGANRGTLIAKNKELQQAIKSCLNSDL